MATQYNQSTRTSYSIHTDNVHVATALSELAAFMNDDTLAFGTVIRALTMAINSMTEGYEPQCSTPEDDRVLVAGMKQLLEKIDEARA